jgi:predicted dehydrogenase
MTDKPIRVGFIGAGDVSILHAAAVNKMDDAQLVGLWNRTESRAQQRAREFNCRVYPTPEKLVADPDIDAVFVLTNLETHLTYCELALNAGKHVFVEKPVSDTVENVQRIADLARQAHRVCMPGHNMIYEDSILRSRELIDAGRLGRLICIYVLYNLHHSEEVMVRYPGVIRQIMTHNLYSLIYLGGLPRRVQAFKACLHYQKLTREDIAMVNIELENGALAHLCASFAADDLTSDPWSFLIKVIGTEGSTCYTYHDWVQAQKGTNHSRTFTAYAGSIANAGCEFIRLIRYGGTPRSTLDDAVSAQRAIEAIERSIATQQSVTC